YDSGNSWHRAKQIAPNRNFAVIFAEQRTFAGTWQDGIYQSSDFGEHWTLVNPNRAPRTVTRFAIADNTLWIGTDLQGIWSLNLADPNAQVVDRSQNLPEGNDRLIWDV